MYYFATVTGTKQNRERMIEEGMLPLVTPETGNEPWAELWPMLDNGAWRAHQQGQPWDAGAFLDLLARFRDAFAVVVPDIVAAGRESLRLSLAWLRLLPSLTEAPLLLLPVQDGMMAEDVGPHLSPTVGIFVGGSTVWKEDTIPAWAAIAQAHGAWCHVGRVNTKRRLRLCQMSGVDSVDGTSPTRFARTAGTIGTVLRQRTLELS